MQQVMKYLALLLTGTLVWSQVVPPLAQASARENQRRLLPGPRPPFEDLATPLARQIPSRLGHVVERFQGRPGQPLVIHLQDAHGHIVGQWHLAHLLDRFTRLVPQRPLWVGVEGAWVPMDTDWLARFPDEHIKRDLATALLRRGELHGEEYVALVAR
ncbi:MAG: hypothetical protein HYZ73_05005, partial [Elusimicrobia bacterium]|nr:hypothetical protein [Elusimicrobiota bacterium]